MSDSGIESESGLSEAETVDAIQQALVEWYEADHRAYPWRETDDPYAVLAPKS